MKRILCLAVLSAAVLLVGGCAEIGCDIGKYDDYVAEVSNSDGFMPAWDSLGDCLDSAVNRKSQRMLLKKSDSIILFVLYPDDDYKKRKAALLKEHNLLTEAVYSESDSKPLIAETSALVEGYTITVADNRESDKNYSFPTSFGMVGYSDEMGGIAYLYFSGERTANIKSLKKFIEDNFVFEVK